MRFSSLFFIIIHWTWCLPQSLIGLLLLTIITLLERPGLSRFWTGTLLVETRLIRGGLSLGFFIFTTSLSETDVEGRGSRRNNTIHYKLLRHEWGHTLQGFLLGPFYLLVIGIPSVIWYHTFRRTGKPYSWLYTERWAEQWGSSRHTAQNTEET